MLTHGGFRNSLVGNKDDNFSQVVFWVTQMFWLKKKKTKKKTISLTHLSPFPYPLETSEDRMNLG